MKKIDLILAPCSISAAKAYTLEHHRHLPKINGGLWAVRVHVGGETRGVAIVGWPSRVQMTAGNEHLRVLRVAVEPGVPNACSMLLGACWKAARSMGALRMDTHTLENESGVSLVAAGWTRGNVSRGGDWNRSSRARSPAACPGPKQIWWAPGSKGVRSRAEVVK